MKTRQSLQSHTLGLDLEITRGGALNPVRALLESHSVPLRLTTDTGLHHFDWSCVNSEGGEVIVDVPLMPILINGQTMLHTTWRDITKRTQVEEALRLSETGLRQLFQESPLSTMLFDKDTGDLVDVNAAAFKAYGCSTLEGLRAYDFWCDPPYSLADALEWNQKASEEGPQQFQWLSQKKSGECFWEDVFLRMLHIQGKHRIIAVSVDITERKRIEEERKKLQTQLNQAQKMESVGRLAGGVAHDFNNMLGVILGYTELCLNKTGPPHPLFNHLQKIHKAAERSATLTRQLLVFARKQLVAPKVLDLKEAVEGMLQMLRRLIGEDINLAWAWPRSMASSSRTTALSTSTASRVTGRRSRSICRNTRPRRPPGPNRNRPRPR